MQRYMGGVVAEVEIADEHVLSVARQLQGPSFSTKQFIAQFAAQYPIVWADAIAAYSQGGKDGGSSYSANSRLSQALKKLSRQGKLKTLGYRQSPDGWGSPVIRYWALSGVLLGKENGVWSLGTGDKISRKVLHETYGGRTQGGIGPSVKSPNVFLFSDLKVGKRHGYVDGWKPDGCFHYTGEGQRGDQQMSQGNAAILRHREEGRSLRLFKGVGGIVTYDGEFELAEDGPSNYTTDAPETNGGPIRSVIVFRLRALDRAPEPAVGVPAINPKIAISTIVPIEESQSERFAVEPSREPYEAEKREGALVKAFCEFLKKDGMAATRIKILPPGEAKPIFCDVFVEATGLLVEAKGTIERNSIRMALGQLLDYSRFADVRTKAILLPTKPREDLQSLIRVAGVGLYYKGDQGGFVYVAP
jgi:hypothetical protein